MSKISASLVKELREKTGAGMLDCRNALQETDGDLDKAVDLLRENVSREEVPEDIINHEKEVLTQQAMNEGKPQNIAEKMVEGRIEKFYKEIVLLEQPFIKDPDKSIETLLKEKIAKIGENIKIRRFVRFEVGEGLEKREENFADEVAKQMGK